MLKYLFANVRVQGYHHLLAQGAELGLLLLLLGAQVLDELYGLLEHHRLAHLDTVTVITNVHVIQCHWSLVTL